RIEYASAIVSLGARTCPTLEFTRSPSTRSLGGEPTVMCRSEAPRWIISCRSTRRLSSWRGRACASAGGAGWFIGSSVRGGRPRSLGDRRFLDHFVERRHAALDLLHAVLAQRQHPLRAREIAQLI